MPRQKAVGGLSVHTTLRIPRELHERLASAAGEDRNIGDEIRQRLELSFQRSDDPKTRELCASVAFMGVLAQSYFLHRWHEDPFTFQVFKIAIEKLLKGYYQPKGEPVWKMEPDSLAYDLWDETITPDEVANVIAAPEILKLREAGTKP